MNHVKSFVFLFCLSAGLLVLGCGTSEVTTSGSGALDPNAELLSESGDIYAARSRCNNIGKLSVAPNPVPFNSTYVINGSKFQAGASITATLERRCDDGITYGETVWMGFADSSGSFSFSRATQWCTGTYVATAYQGKRGPCGTISFPVR